MLDVLLQLPMGTQNLKETIVANMGFLGQMTGVRETNAAWSEVKKKAAREYPDKFLLDERGALTWNDGTRKMLDRKISTASIKKLNALAEAEGCDVNEMVLRLLRGYSTTKSKS